MKVISADLEPAHEQARAGSENPETPYGYRDVPVCRSETSTTSAEGLDWHEELPDDVDQDNPLGGPS